MPNNGMNVLQSRIIQTIEDEFSGLIHELAMEIFERLTEAERTET